jgi:hypothetical protein
MKYGNTVLKIMVDINIIDIIDTIDIIDIIVLLRVE